MFKTELNYEALKIILCFGILTFAYFAFLFGFFLRSTRNKDLIELTIGGALYSISLIHILPRAELFIPGEYPYASLIAIMIFVILTLYTFIKDALALMDENILTSYDVINRHTTSNGPLLPNEPLVANENNHSPFQISEHIIVSLLYIAEILYSIANGLFFTNFPEKYIIKTVICHILIRFMEMTIVGHYLKTTHCSSTIYWILASLLSIIEPILVAAPMSVDNGIVKKISGYISSVILGFYVYLGSVALNSAMTSTSHTFLVSSAVFLSSVIIPAGLFYGLRFVFKSSD